MAEDLERVIERVADNYSDEIAALLVAGVKAGMVKLVFDEAGTPHADPDSAVAFLAAQPKFLELCARVMAEIEEAAEAEQEELPDA